MFPRFNGAALFQVRKDGRRGPIEAEPCGFNGAALFQVRKVVCQRADLPEPPGRFNGAALFQVRKVQAPQKEALLHGGASMGPHSFKCGK